VKLVHLRDWELIGSRLAGFSATHVGRFLTTGRISNLCQPERRKFLQDLTFRLSSLGHLNLSQLTVGDRPIAWNYGFQFAGSWFWYQPTFDSNFERYSPGFCLLSRMISEAADNPAIQHIDLGLGAEGYKERFANAGRQTLHVTLTRSLRRHVGESI